MLRNSVINFALKLGLAFSLFFSGLASLVVPDHVLSFWPSFITSNLNESFILLISGIVSFGLIGWLFSKKAQFASATTTGACIALTGLFNLTNVPFIVDIAPLFFISLALSLRYYPRIRVIAQTKVTPLSSITIHKNLDNSPGIKGPEISDVTESVVESGVHEEHDQHIFVPKQ